MKRLGLIVVAVAACLLIFADFADAQPWPNADARGPWTPTPSASWAPPSPTTGRWSNADDRGPWTPTPAASGASGSNDGRWVNADNAGPWTPVPQSGTQPTAASNPASATGQLVAWYDFDEWNTTRIEDRARNHHGAIVGDVDRVEGVSQRGIATQRGGQVEVPPASHLDFGRNDFTITYWIKTAQSTGTQNLVEKRSMQQWGCKVPPCESMSGFSAFLWQGHVGLQLADNGGTTNQCVSSAYGSANCTNYVSLENATFVADGRWHFVAISVDRDQKDGLKYYVDGQHVSTFDPTNRPGSVSSGSALEIASGGSSNTLDEVKLYNYALGDGAVSAEFRSIRPNAQPTVAPTAQASSGQCAQQPDVPRSECEALFAIYAKTNGSTWKKDRWNTFVSICKWGGITCQNGHVVRLILPNRGIKTAIPAEVGELRELVFLDMALNEITGQIPASIGNLTKLERLNLSQNQLTGTIPPEIGSLTQLFELNLFENDLYGPIPAEFGNLRSLLYARINNNRLSGSLPATLGQLTPLTTFYVNDNPLSGPLPREMLQLQKLSGFQFQNTQICVPSDAEFTAWLRQSGGGVDRANSGIYCDGVGPAAPTPTPTRVMAPSVSAETACTNIVGIPQQECATLLAFYTSTNGSTWDPGPSHLVYNHWFSTPYPCGWRGLICDSGHISEIALTYAGLSGTLPNSLHQLTNLRVLDVGNNDLSGSIPSSYAQFTRLEQFSINHNNYSGVLPSAIAQLKTVKKLELSANQFSGWIPGWLGDLTNLEELWLGQNDFTGGVPPQIGKLTNLQKLSFFSNDELSGPLPDSYTALNGLDTLNLVHTKLCIPTTPAFEAWIARTSFRVNPQQRC